MTQLMTQDETEKRREYNRLLAVEVNGLRNRIIMRHRLRVLSRATDLSASEEHILLSYGILPGGTSCDTFLKPVCFVNHLTCSPLREFDSRYRRLS